MNVVVRSNNNSVNDINAAMSGIINDLAKVIRTNSSQILLA